MEQSCLKSSFMCSFLTVDHLVAQIGPNVSISANVRVGPGVRLISCIILDDVEIKVCQSMRIYKLQLKPMSVFL